MSGNHEHSPEFAAVVLGHLYALAAAHILGDREAIGIILEEVDEDETVFMPAAAIAVAYSCLRTLRRDDDPFDDPQIASLPTAVRQAIADVLNGEAPDLFMLEDGEDPVEVSMEIVGAMWLWAGRGDRSTALDIARRNCANMVRYRAEGGSTGGF